MSNKNQTWTQPKPLHEGTVKKGGVNQPPKLLLRHPLGKATKLPLIVRKISGILKPRIRLTSRYS